MDDIEKWLANNEQLFKDDDLFVRGFAYFVKGWGDYTGCRFNDGTSLSQDYASSYKYLFYAVKYLYPLYTKNKLNDIGYIILGKSLEGIALCLQAGYGCEENYNAAFNCAKKSYEIYNSEASALLMGNFYFYGHGVEKDPQQAYNWWKKEAARGSKVCKQAIREHFE